MRTRRKFLPWLETWELYPGVLEGHPGCSPCGWERRGFAASSLGAVAMGSAKSPGQPSFCPIFFLPALFALDHYSFISFYTPLPAEGRAGTERALQHHLGSLKMPRAHPHSTFGNRDNVQTPILQHQALSTAEKEILCGAGEKNARGCELHRSNFIAVSSRRYIQPYFYAHT